MSNKTVSLGRTAALGATVMVASAVVAFGVATGTAGAQTPASVNQRGQVLGELEGNAPNEYAELVRVQATNGRPGYIDSARLNELTGGDVNTPEEAIAWQSLMDKTPPEELFLPVYAEDGVTQVGVFPITRGEAGTSRQ